MQCSAVKCIAVQFTSVQWSVVHWKCSEGVTFLVRGSEGGAIKAVIKEQTVKTVVDL